MIEQRPGRLRKRVVAAVLVTAAGVGVSTIETPTTVPCKFSSRIPDTWICPPTPGLTAGYEIGIAPDTNGDHKIKIFRTGASVPKVREGEDGIPAHEAMPGSVHRIPVTKTGEVVLVKFPDTPTDEAQSRISIRAQYPQTLLERALS